MVGDKFKVDMEMNDMNEFMGSWTDEDFGGFKACIMYLYEYLTGSSLVGVLCLI